MRNVTHVGLVLACCVPLLATIACTPKMQPRTVSSPNHPAAATGKLAGAPAAYAGASTAGAPLVPAASPAGQPAAPTTPAVPAPAHQHKH